MKVIVMAQALLPWSGGSAISEASLCQSLGNHCELNVLCRKGSLDYAFARGFDLNEVHLYYPRDAARAWRDRTHWLNGFIQESDILHLNGHWRWEHYFFALLCARWNKPFVLQPRGMLLVGHRNTALKKVFNLAIGKPVVNHASKVIALSHFEVDQFSPYSIPNDRVVILPNGIPSSKSVKVPDDFSPPHGKAPYFLYLGRLESRKNLIFLCDVYAAYVKQGGTASLLLMGPVERGYDAELREKIRSLALTHRIHVLPPVYEPEKWFYIKKAKAVIYPTLDEPFGRVPFEAVSAGTFPIIPNRSGSAEYLHSYLPFCVYEHQNPDSLLRTMIEVERHSPNDINLARAQDWVHQELNWDRIAQEVIQVYQGILEPISKPVPAAAG